MTDTEKIELIREALGDVANGSLREKVFLHVVGGIVGGLGEITEADIKWGKEAIERYENGYTA